MRVYVSGPVTGVEGRNALQFARCAASWGERGCSVYNPVEEIGDGTAHDEAMRTCIGELASGRCDLVCMLPGWERSAGALEERAFALEAGIPVVYWDAGNRLC